MDMLQVDGIFDSIFQKENIRVSTKSDFAFAWIFC